MPHFVCMVQAGQPADLAQAQLAAGLKQIGRDLLADPSDGIEIAWHSIARGFGFTAGAPSTSSLVVRSVPVGFPDAEREAFLSRVCELWTKLTGCSPNEIMVTAFDGPLPL
jgi:hypothetical protein